MYINIPFLYKGWTEHEWVWKKETVSNKIDSAFCYLTIIGQVNNRAVLQKGVHKLIKHTTLHLFGWFIFL